VAFKLKSDQYYAAWIPLLIISRDPGTALVIGGIFSIFAILLFYFFQGARKLFPKRLFKFSCVLCLAVLAQIGHVLFLISPFWAASIFILFWVAPGVMEEERGSIHNAKVLFMAVSLIPMAFLRRTLEQYLAWGPLQQAVLIYLFLATLALFFRYISSPRYMEKPTV